jgi:hypothetical protein
MRRFENTSIWQNTLATQPNQDPEAANRSRLRAAFEGFRERAGMLAGEIEIDLPEFTVHDVSHLDALWEMAQLIVGPGFPLTPAEAFVLGGAFLIHDLGMGLAAYPEGINALRRSELWKDSVAAYLKEEYERQPTQDEINNPPVSIYNRAMRQILRELHAKQAESLALISWKDRHTDSTEYFLIDDPGLRNTYGPIIGKIAHSHWWPSDQLTQYLPVEMGAPGGFNNSWTVDPVKLACILRTADASHLDERRAPGFLGALRKPVGVSASHWIFQEKLYQPRLESDRLVYTSKSTFTVNEAPAWWTCFDALQVVDRELRQVDALLADTNRPRLAARGVSCAEDPMRMAKFIGTSNWLPVDARIKVGDVAKLISTLGGEKLYGHNEIVPLRELIQNAGDAVRARRLLEGYPKDWGGVTVRCGDDAEGQWIEVEDTGIGMSIGVLAGPFLDFGTSFWGTPLMHKELPGLESKGFSSTGQFGIGFYSVFMWGDHVQVITRRAERAREETLIMEFHNGLTDRPILRRAEASERLIEGGTRVRVWFRSDNSFEMMLSRSEQQRPWKLEELCAWLCPTLDVNLYVERKGKQLVVGASDWISMKGSKLIQRLLGPIRWDRKADFATLTSAMAPNLRLIKTASGEVVGRACVFFGKIERGKKRVKYYERFDAGVVSVGGFRSCGLHDICGVLIGTPQTAARNMGVPLVGSDVLRSWASEQAALIVQNSLSSEDQAECASVICALGGATQQLHIAEDASGWKSAEEISRECPYGEVLILQDDTLNILRRDLGEVVLNGNVFAVSVGSRSILGIRSSDPWIDWPPERESDDGWNSDWSFHSKTLQGVVMESIAMAWGIPLAHVLKASQQSTDSKDIEREIGMCNGNPVVERVDVICRPSAS